MSNFNLKSKVSENTFTFENFAVKDTNRFAYACAQIIADNSNIVYNPLVIYGPSGVGKTHLVRAIENAVRQKHSNKTIEFITGEGLSNQIVKALNDELDIDEFEARYCNVDMLIIDDLHLIAAKKAVQKEVFNILNELYQNNKQIVVTLDRNIREAKLDNKIKSILLNGLFGDIVPDDFEENEEI